MVSGGIIPLREKIGNYDSAFGAYSTWFNYTTTRENWELRLGCDWLEVMRYYTTTRENWELRLLCNISFCFNHYTTTRENWELRQRK